MASTYTTNKTVLPVVDFAHYQAATQIYHCSSLPQAGLAHIGCVPRYVANDITEIGIVIRRKLPFENTRSTGFGQIAHRRCVQSINRLPPSAQSAEHIGAPRCASTSSHFTSALKGLPST